MSSSVICQAKDSRGWVNAIVVKPLIFSDMVEHSLSDFEMGEVPLEEPGYFLFPTPGVLNPEGEPKKE